MTRKEALLKKEETLSKHSDCIVLCRVGNFYEAYDMDAIELKFSCGLYVAIRDGGIGQVAGFPHHRLDIYLRELIRGGNRVMILE